MAKDLLYPSRIGAPGSLNMDTRNAGRAVPAFKQFTLGSTDRLHYAHGVIEYKAPTGTTSGAAPRQYCGINTHMYRLDNGTITDDRTHSDVGQGMVLADSTGFTGIATAVSSTTLTDSTANWPTNFFNGQVVRMGGQTLTVTSNSATVITGSGGWSSTPDTGYYVVDSDSTALLVVGFGSSTAPRIAYRDLSTDTTPWTEQTAATYAQFWLITRAGPDFYAMTDAGVASLGEWRISKCPGGNDVRLASSWGNGFGVGGPEWGITGLTAIGDSPVVGKPDGLWYYDTQTRRYENVLKHLEIVPHALNGKVTESVTNGVIYTTHDGKAYFFDGVSVTEVSPNKFWPILSRDIGNSRITAIADNGETIAMFTELAYQTTQNAGLVVNTVTSAGAATAITTNVVDGSMATGGDVSSLAATSHIDVWADIPFEGVVMHVTRNSNSTAAAVFGTVSYSSANDTFTADANGFYDGTRLSAGGSLSYVAFPPSASAGAVIGKSPDFGTNMTKVDFNYSSGTDVSQKYGMRISMSGSAFDASTNIDELEIIPYRAGMPSGGIYSASNNFTSRDRAGLIGHVYLIKRTRTTGFTPHDCYAVDSGPGVWKMAWHTGRLGQASGGQNLGQSLILWGRYKQIAISESLTRDPVRTRRPFVQGVGTSAPGPLMQICHDWAGAKDEEWMQRKQLSKLHIDTRLMQTGDSTEIFYEVDGRDIKSLGVYKGGPLHIDCSAIPPFRWINLYVGFSQSAATVPNAPYFVEPYILEYTLSSGEHPQDPSAPSDGREIA